jgi:hypothetical protein
MNPRERFLAMTLLGLVIVLGGLGLFHVLVYKPLSDLGTQLDAADKERTDKAKELAGVNKEIDRIKKLDPRLTVWEKISLPDAASRDPDETNKHLRKIQVEYEQEINKVLNRAGVRNIKILAQAPDLKSGPPINPKDKTPFYKKLPFSIEGTGSLAAVVQSMEDFHRMNLLHEVRNFSLVKPQTLQQGAAPGDLDIKIGLEALIVNGAGKRAELMPASDPKIKYPAVLQRGRGDYQSILTHNMFTGVAGEGPRQYEKPEDVLRFVKLTSITYTGRRWEATMYDQGKGGKEIDVNVGGLTTKGEFSVSDRYDNVLCIGHVLDMDSRGFVFQYRGLFHRMDAGQSLDGALKQSLPIVNLVVGPLGTAGKPVD